MKRRLEEILCCPECGRSFEIRPFIKKGDEIIEGLLISDCGEIYPIVGSIPRVLPDAFSDHPEFVNKYRRDIEDIKQKSDTSGEESKAHSEKFDKLRKATQRSFGYQWSYFSDMACDFRENFLNYISPVNREYFKGKIGLDMGCGFGRHLYNALQFGAEMVGVDISRAIDSSYKNTRDFSNIHLVQADVYKLPFKKGSFDFAYSIGVLHHLPEPEKGFGSILPALKEKGEIFIWVYSKKRKVINFFLELVRKITHRLPLKFLRYICLIAAFIDWFFFLLPYKLLKDVPVVGAVLERIEFRRVKVYHKYPWQVIYADWFDRLSPPLRFYYDEKEIQDWFERANLREVIISPTGLYGLRAYGKK